MLMRHNTVQFRPACLADAANIRAMQDASLRLLAGADYAPHEIAGFIENVGTLDLESVAEGRYVIAEIDGEIVASAGWKADVSEIWQFPEGPAKVEKTGSFSTLLGVYADPSMVRHGLATRALSFVEAQILGHGQLGIVTVTAYAGMPFLTRMGFLPTRLASADLKDGKTIQGVEMRKSFPHALRPVLQRAA